jgi:predicted ester cyclase
MNGGDLDAADDLVAPEHVNHDPTAPGVPPGPEGVKELIWMYRSAFPDIRFETGEMIGEGDTVAHRWTFLGTHRGEMTGVEPTGRRVVVAGVEMNRVQNGRISASWTVSDALGLMQQLGLTPPRRRRLGSPSLAAVTGRGRVVRIWVVDP